MLKRIRSAFSLSCRLSMIANSSFEALFCTDEKIQIIIHQLHHYYWLNMHISIVKPVRHMHLRLHNFGDKWPPSNGDLFTKQVAAFCYYGHYYCQSFNSQNMLQIEWSSNAQHREQPGRNCTYNCHNNKTKCNTCNICHMFNFHLLTRDTQFLVVLFN